MTDYDSSTRPTSANSGQMWGTMPFTSQMKILTLAAQGWGTHLVYASVIGLCGVRKTLTSLSGLAPTFCQSTGD